MTREQLIEKNAVLYYHELYNYPLSLLKTGSGITSDNFLDPGYDIRIDSEKRYDAPSPRIGFRVIAVRKK